MKKEYSDIVQDVCNINYWKKPYVISSNMSEAEKQELEGASQAEIDGAIGVACVLAYFKGVPAELNSLSYAIGVPADEVSAPYHRLLINGIFNNVMDLRNDDVLKGRCKGFSPNPSSSNPIWVSAPERCRNAWCMIAGYASGYYGVN